MSKIELYKDFKPVSRFKKYNLIVYCLAVILIWLSFGWIGIVIESSLVNIIMVGLLVFCLCFVGVWNILYYKSVVYNLNSTEMTWKRGVWFRQTGIVPYNRITNVDIVQGPLMRLFNISSLSIQTAGYSAQKMAEINIIGIEEPEPLRGMIMDFVRAGGVLPAATGGAGDGEAQPLCGSEVIDELREIKSILKKIAEK